MTADALSVDALSGGYGRLVVFEGATFTVNRGEIIGILGSNGAGKTTLLKTIAGLLAVRAGRISVDGADVTPQPAFRRARHGLALVPQGRGIMAELTVAENLDLPRAALRGTAAEYDVRLERALTLFPRLRERLQQKGGSLSGGEQQMLAIARAVILDPAVLMLDEPTQGLAPIVITQLAAAIRTLAEERAVLLVEQNRAFLEELAGRVLTMSERTIRPATLI
jgi:ABC-type branched-subunit amino acid transport system ATPase component